MLAREIPGEPRDQRLGLVGIRIQHANDVLHGDRIMIRMPAIEIGDHRDAGVADLRLAGEFGLGHVGHADHRIALRLVGQAFGEAGELRTFHADISAALHGRDALGLGGGRQMHVQPRRHRMGHRDMGDAALAEERTLALVGAVDELIDQHEGAGRQLLPERTAGRERNQVGDPCPFQHVDIGAVVDVGGRQHMSLAVPRQEHDRQAGDDAARQGCGRLAPGAFDRLVADIFQPRQVVDAGSADNAKHGMRHDFSRSGLVTARCSTILRRNNQPLSAGCKRTLKCRPRKTGKSASPSSTPACA